MSEIHAGIGATIAIIAIGAAFAACAVPPDQETESAAALAGDAPAEPCVAGTWVTAPRACSCPLSAADAYTAECAAPDCREADLLLLWPWGEAVRATIRYSGSDARLSSVGGDPSEGRWTSYDDGELRLEFDDNAIYTPTECQEDELQMKDHPAMTHPPAALDAAIFWAWLLEEWSDAPYTP